jgi:acetolactate synthase-1/2/3 large subunit
VRQARASHQTFVVEFRVEQEDAVYPMVPAGAELQDMIRRPHDKGGDHNPIFETAED